MSVHEQVVYRNIYTFAIKKRLNEPFSEICPAPIQVPLHILGLTSVNGLDSNMRVPVLAYQYALYHEVTKTMYLRCGACLDGERSVSWGRSKSGLSSMKPS
jgi:hypothetical protein